MPVDFATVSPPDKPNWALTAPGKLGNPHAEPAPIFGVNADALQAAVLVAFEAEPRTRLVSHDPVRRRMTFIQRSAVLRFVDNIEVEIFPLGEDQTSLALFSRSQVGYSDLGVNRSRVARVLARLTEALPLASSQSGGDQGPHAPAT